jgi:putative transposase
MVRVKPIENCSKAVSEQFRRFFLSYSKSIKIQEARTGSLFEKNFKRQRIEDEKHLIWRVNYIHRNAEKHKLTGDYKNYCHSSYKSLLSDLPTKLERAEVLDWFGGKEGFIRFHQTNPLNNSDIPYLADMEYL